MQELGPACGILRSRLVMSHMYMPRTALSERPVGHFCCLVRQKVQNSGAQAAILGAFSSTKHPSTQGRSRDTVRALCAPIWAEHAARLVRREPSRCLASVLVWKDAWWRKKTPRAMTQI